MQYGCQKRTQTLLDHMYPVPEYFKVDPKYLPGLSEVEFIDGFKCLWSVVGDIYRAIIEDPASFGLPCYEPSEETVNRGKFDPKNAECGNSSRRLMEYLGMLCQIGDLQGNKLVVPLGIYVERLKTLKPGVTGVASHMLINRLIDFGFAFAGFNGKAFDKGMDHFIVSYEDSKNLIPALKGYCTMPAKCREKFCACHYDSVAAPDTIPQPVCAFVFSQYFTGRQREFFIRFNERMLEEGFVCINSPSYPFTLEYFRQEQLPLDKKKPHVVRCFSDNNKLDIVMKMMDIADYNTYIEKLPGRIKICYKASHCRNCFGDWRECASAKRWTIDGESFADCQWGDGAHISNFDPDDIDTYISIIKMEAGAKRYR